jgi:hypothetical protein
MAFATSHGTIADEGTRHLREQRLAGRNPSGVEHEQAIAFDVISMFDVIWKLTRR